jgi:hypothetical protein
VQVSPEFAGTIFKAIEADPNRIGNQQSSGTNYTLKGPVKRIF